MLSLRPEALSRYRLRGSTRSDHLCTAEVAALCLDLAGESAAANTLDALLDVFTEHYLGAKYHRQPDLQNAAHLALKPAR